ncbi:MAG: NUDIX hydrolase [Clostridiales bacterium]|jgi:ADP-ribose pyrophosphatase|nr:NUDIX hydrolase [Clostridiales bacterium]
MADSTSDYQIVSGKTVFEGLLVQMRHDRIRLPDGREALREVVIHGPGAAVLPVDTDGKLIFVRQYRHPIQDMALEMPAGVCEKGEDPAVCAARELEEETGIQADKITFLFRFYSSIGFCTEELFLYLAEGIHQGEQRLDEDEFVTLETYTPQEAFDMIRRGEIVDAKTIAAVLYYIHEHLDLPASL